MGRPSTQLAPAPEFVRLFRAVVLDAYRTGMMTRGARRPSSTGGWLRQASGSHGSRSSASTKARSTERLTSATPTGSPRERAVLLLSR
jgi:hypothetical protein